MKNKINEINELPEIFNHIKFGKYSKIKTINKKEVHFNSCDKYQTDFFALEKPDKNLVRLV